MGISYQQGLHNYLNIFITESGSPKTGLNAHDVRIKYQKQGDLTLTDKDVEVQDTTQVASLDGNSTTLYVADSSIFPVDFGRIAIDPGGEREEFFEVKRNTVSSGRVDLNAVAQETAVIVGTTTVSGNTTTVLTIGTIGTPIAIDDEHAGKLIRVASGSQENQYRVIASNTSTTITVTDALGTVAADLDGVSFEILTNSTTTFTAQPGIANDFIPLPTDILLSNNPLSYTNFVVAVISGAGAGQRSKILNSDVNFVRPQIAFSATNPVDDTSVFQIQPNREHPISEVVRLLDWIEVGSGMYSILFQATELDTLDAFTYFVTEHPDTATTTFDDPAPVSVDIEASTSTATPGAVASGLLTCRLVGNVSSLLGISSENIAVQARIISSPQFLSDIGISTSVVSTRTDSTGYFELEVVRGAVVDVIISEMNYRRTLTVPNQALADLFTIP